MSGQWMVGSDGVRWHFDAGACSLDFGYTGNFGWPGIIWEHLHTPADLTAWLREHLTSDIQEAGPTDLEQALALREAITSLARAIVLGTEHPQSSLRCIDAFAAAADIPPQLSEGAPPAGWEVSRALATIARDAVQVLGGGAAGLRMCDADDCSLIFRDTSRPGSRRWCSMQRCGNRRKMRLRNQRQASTRRAQNSEGESLQS